MRLFALAFLSFVSLASAAPAPEPARRPADAEYQRQRPTRDGIGKVYFGREIAQVMGHQGASWLERPEREQEERTDLLVAALGLEDGMVVADVGAGSGYFTWRIAREIGSKGRVYAVDIQPEMLKLLQENLSRRGLSDGVHPTLGTEQDPRLPDGAIDLILLVDVYHELAFPFEMTRAMVRALKPGGRLVLVEYRAEDPTVPIKPLHTMTVAQVRRELAVHPVTFERNIAVLPWQHILVFRKD